MTLTELYRKVSLYMEGITSQAFNELVRSTYVQQKGENRLKFALCIDNWDDVTEDLLNKDFQLPRYIVFWQLKGYGWVIEGFQSEVELEIALKRVCESDEVIKVVRGQVSVVRNSKTSEKKKVVDSTAPRGIPKKSLEVSRAKGNEERVVKPGQKEYYNPFSTLKGVKH